MSIENNVLVKLNNVGLKQNQKWLVQGVSLQVEKGKIVTLIGPNGSGKSTLLGLISGLYIPSSGTVNISSNKLGYIGVTPLVFDGSIKENLILLFLGNKLASRNLPAVDVYFSNF